MIIYIIISGRGNIRVKNLLYKRNPMLVLSYLSKSDGPTYGRKISQEIGINQGSVSIILRDFKDSGLVKSKNVGKTILYYANKHDPIMKAFRLFENLLELTCLVNQIKQYAREIILFGSCAKGEDDNNSDIDLFVVADNDNHQTIRDAIAGYEIDRPINSVLVDTLEAMDLEETDKGFLDETYKGIRLWEGGRDSSEE